MRNNHHTCVAVGAAGGGEEEEEDGVRVLRVRGGAKQVLGGISRDCCLPIFHRSPRMVQVCVQLAFGRCPHPACLRGSPSYGPKFIEHLTETVGGLRSHLGTSRRSDSATTCMASSAIWYPLIALTW